jgi:hypothetical protein
MTCFQEFVGVIASINAYLFSGITRKGARSKEANGEATFCYLLFSLAQCEKFFSVLLQDTPWGVPT